MAETSVSPARKVKEVVSVWNCLWQLHPPRKTPPRLHHPRLLPTTTTATPRLTSNPDEGGGRQHDQGARKRVVLPAPPGACRTVERAGAPYLHGRRSSGPAHENAPSTPVGGLM